MESKCVEMPQHSTYHTAPAPAHTIRRLCQTFRWTVTFKTLFWDNALTADTLELRAYR